MRTTLSLWVGVVGALMLAGCADAVADRGDPGTPVARADDDKAADKSVNKQDEDEAEIKENLAKLQPRDRKTAEAQKYCAVQSDERLGSMGTPYKVTLKGQTVFLCCKGCAKQAQKDPDKTLAKVEELKKQAKKEAQKP